jgi:hypothetical protein
MGGVARGRAARGGEWSAVQVPRLVEAAAIPFQVANVGVA